MPGCTQAIGKSFETQAATDSALFLRNGIETPAILPSYLDSAVLFNAVHAENSVRPGTTG
jgi:hypothetical protein